MFKFLPLNFLKLFYFLFLLYSIFAFSSLLFYFYFIFLFYYFYSSIIIFISFYFTIILLLLKIKIIILKCSLQDDEIHILGGFHRGIFGFPYMSPSEVDLRIDAILDLEDESNLTLLHLEESTKDYEQLNSLCFTQDKCVAL